ncbi:MAG TPA: Asp-tRNA(Asn)/Glu-tRNA(Gln) amidotransferase subunit GatC [Gemmatimonadales bacterium]|nr:Asp-tRNA(Asn)/Glu-tRNA(Gln) amidotransferase subunit GatC [Gemmatimonadales bacterium]
MTIGRDEVRHVARLAELAVPEEELDRLVQQLNRIVEYVAQLDRLPAAAAVEPFLPGPRAVALREDAPGSVPLARPPAELAPEFADGFFLVPRHEAMEDQ